MTDIAGIDVARIEIRLGEATVRTRPGSTLENPVTLVNLTPLPDFFYLAISGNPAPWASFDKESVNLFPNWSDVINLTLIVPEETPPGSYVLEIEASSHTQDNVKSRIQLGIVVESPSGGTHPASAPELNPAAPPTHGNLPENPFLNPNPANFQEPFTPPPDFPRLQIDLDFGQVTVVAGQTAEQTAYLLNLSTGPHNFSIGLDGLPPEWITVDPPFLRLSPNWSEVARFKIAVPVDAFPGRYLLTARAIPETQPEAVAWRQFDIVILPAAVPPSTTTPDNTNASALTHPVGMEPEGSHFGAEKFQAAQTPVAPELPANTLPVPTPEVRPAMPPSAPISEQVAPPPPAWNQPVLGAPAQTQGPAPEAPKGKPDNKQKGGLFGWRKKKAEPVANEPILFVPFNPAPAEATPVKPFTPVEVAPVEATLEPVAAPITAPEAAAKLPETESEVAPPIEDDSPTRQIILPATPAPSSELEEVNLPIGSNGESITLPSPALEAIEAPTVNAPIDEIATINPPIDEVPTVNPALEEDTPTVPPTGIPGLESATLAAMEQEPAEVETVEAVEDKSTVTSETVEPAIPPEPAVVRNENIELNVENVKIRFELGNSYEQQVGLINLMGNPAFFDLKVEGIPENWYNFSYSQINLFPNWREQVYFRLEAPTDTTPGQFSATLVVASPNLPGDRVEIPLEIEVLPSATLADKLYRATGAGLPVKLTADARIELVVNTVNLTLEPDNNLEQTITLVNRSPIPDLFDLKLEGLLENWYQFSTPQVNLFPNWQEEIYLRIGLPLNAVPGLYPVRMLVTGQQYSELHAEQTLLLQVLPPTPKPAEEVNPPIGSLDENADTISSRLTNAAVESEPTAATETVEDDATGTAQPFSFASFFQQQNFTTGPAAPKQAPAPETTQAPASNLPVVPSAPEATYNQPTTAFPAYGASTPALYPYDNPSAPAPAPSPGYAPAPGYTLTPANAQPTGAVPAANAYNNSQGMGAAQPYVLTPQTSLAGIIPVISAQPEAPVPPPLVEEPMPLPVAPPRKRSLWQRITGQGKEQPAPVTPKVDESVLWRSGQAQAPAPAKQSGKAAPPSAEPVSAQATQVNWKAPTTTQGASAGEYPIGGTAAPAQPGQRSYTPMSTGGEVARVQITLEKPHMTIVAGQKDTQQIFLMNMTSLPDNFELTIEGLPETWFSFENTTVNLFPNWNEHTVLTMNISEKVKPELYKGRIVVAAKAQTGVRAVMPIEVEVLAPLVVQARLQPHRAKGYKANYEMLLRNRSMSQGLMTMQWDLANSYSVGTFTPPQIVLGPGQSQHVKVQVMLRKKTPKDQARQLQPFKVMVQPQWTVAQVPVLTAPVSVEGEYIHRSRWVFIQRHPVLFTFLTIILLIVLLWNLLLLPFIQTSLLTLSLGKVGFSDVAAKVLMADQIGFNLRMKDANPLGVIQTDVIFKEAPDKSTNGIVTIRMQTFVFTGDNAATLSGSLEVDPITGDLKFVAANPKQLGSFPWLFIPPDKVVQTLSGKLKTWLKEQNPPQRMDNVYIEGNTLFITLKNCQSGEIACR
ncbi:MAG: hypothetical protein J0I20_01105 [Chloroflexi bacterium]|nr:hypothetical protein [Chloroflexota bacterium]OJV89611.1 MAG: hypothetical protein BGO39_37275 [Chloroflexi bacterium 54-19]